MNIDYDNAKLIYRIFKTEGRVKQTPAHVKKYVNLLKNDLTGLARAVNPNVFRKVANDYRAMWEVQPTVQVRADQNTATEQNKGKSSVAPQFSFGLPVTFDSDAPAG